MDSVVSLKRTEYNQTLSKDWAGQIFSAEKEVEHEESWSSKLNKSTVLKSQAITIWTGLD